MEAAISRRPWPSDTPTWRAHGGNGLVGHSSRPAPSPWRRGGRPRR
ncbi:hypothetical protein AB0D24_23605 [Streptomyces javensis]